LQSIAQYKPFCYKQIYYLNKYTTLTYVDRLTNILKVTARYGLCISSNMKKAGETYESVGEKTPPSSREGEGTEGAQKPRASELNSRE